MPSKRLGLKFSGQEPFGRICVALTQENVPFSLREFRTIYLDNVATIDELLERLPATSAARMLLKDYSTSNLVKVVGVATVHKRRLLTP